MGLDTSHDCWHGAYSLFAEWRQAISNLAGYGPLDDYEYFGGDKRWPVEDELEVLLHHSDCDGYIDTRDCGPIADSLEKLLPRTEGWHTGATRQFIDGLRAAAKAGEPVLFH
jgi:hypothetical protein